MTTDPVATLRDPRWVVVDSDGVHLGRYTLDAFIAAHGRAEAEAELARAGLQLNPDYPPALPMVFLTAAVFETPQGAIPLLRADPHRWGSGLVHQIDPERDQTLCGKSPATCPGTKVLRRRRPHNLQVMPALARSARQCRSGTTAICRATAAMGDPQAPMVDCLQCLSREPGVAGQTGEGAAARQWALRRLR